MTPLTKMEVKLKQCCESYPKSFNCSHMTESELSKVINATGINFNDILERPLNNSLNEDDFFAVGENVAVLKHARYLPPLVHDHVFFELVYVRDGYCTHYLDGKDYELSKGDICIIPPSHEHSISAFNDEADIVNLQMRKSTFENAFFGILSEKDVISDFFMHGLYDIKGNYCLTFRTGDDTLLKEISETMLKEANGNEKYRGRMLDSLISTFLIHLLRRHEKDIVVAPDIHNENEDNLILMLQYIQNNYATLSLNELADFFGYSTRHISRLIKDHTGKNFAEITKELRMKKAAELLHNPDMSIEAVMEIVGYSDVSTFYKAFRGYYGMPPAEYRKKL